MKIVWNVLEISENRKFSYCLTKIVYILLFRSPKKSKIRENFQILNFINHSKLALNIQNNSSRKLSRFYQQR